MPEQLKNKIKGLPNRPGIYQFYNIDQELIYVGKAKKLRNRVSSYFNKQSYENRKTKLMVSKINDLKYIEVASELDALLLENNLIKEHKPRYNVQLKDDKTFPWICVKNERFPRIFSTRNKIKDGSSYFGPYASVKLMKTLLDLARQLYPLRTCNYNLSKENIEKEKFKICLEYHLGNCHGPCEGKQSEIDYNKSITAIKKIIEGNIQEVLDLLESEMKASAQNMMFEKAQLLKEKIESLKRYQSKSTVVSPSIYNVDVYSVVSDQKSGFVNYMKVINGAIVKGHTTELKKKLDESDRELLSFAISSMNEHDPNEKLEILVPFEIQHGLPNVTITVPQRGDKKKLLELSERNAKYYRLEKLKQEKIVNPEKHQNRILNQLRTDLRLSENPLHIECFDNSNIQGSNPVAACIVFRNAKPSKKEYRHFNIKTVQGPDDYASMREVVHRRYKRLLDEGKSLPQLIVIDGGKGQLSSAMESLKLLGLDGQIAIIGIAKRLEEIYFPDDSIPIYLDKRSESLKLIQHMRNEAHRFGIKHHRNKRSKEMTKTELDSIPGVGPITSKKLLQHFKSVKNIKEASEEKIQEVIGTQKGSIVFQFFRL